MPQIMGGESASQFCRCVSDFENLFSYSERYVFYTKPMELKNKGIQQRKIQPAFILSMKKIMKNDNLFFKT